MRYIYGVFVDPSKWGLTYNKRHAVRAARSRNGYVVRNRYEPVSRDDLTRGLVTGWDAPTFHIVGEVIADFRAAAGTS